MTRRLKTPLALAVALALALAAPAASAASTDSVRAPVRTTGPTATATSQTRSADTGAELRMSRLIGMDVHDGAGRKLGEVNDVILDTGTGRIHYAVLAFGGFLGVGDRLFAVPAGKLALRGRDKLVLDVGKEQLRSMPGFERNRWPNWNVDAYRSEVDRRYGSAQGATNVRYRRASDVLKAEVRDANGADIGDIEDIVVDIANGRVHYVVVEFDRAWNPNDKLVALPMSALADGAIAPPRGDGNAAAPPRNPPGFLSFENPAGPTKGTASAATPPGGVPTRPAIAAEAASGTAVQPIAPAPLPTTTSYADDEDLVFRGTREQLRDAPEFDKDRWPDRGDARVRRDFDRRLSNW